MVSPRVKHKREREVHSVGTAISRPGASSQFQLQDHEELPGKGRKLQGSGNRTSWGLSPDFSKKILGTAAPGSLSSVTSSYFLFLPISVVGIWTDSERDPLSFCFNQAHAASTGPKEVYMSKNKPTQLPPRLRKYFSLVGLVLSQSSSQHMLGPVQISAVSGELDWSGKF